MQHQMSLVTPSAAQALLPEPVDRPPTSCALLPSSAVPPKALACLPQLEESEDWVDHVDDIITRFEEETGRRPIYSVMFY